MKTRIVKGKSLAGALLWLGYDYTRDKEGNYVFERDWKFDRAFKDLHALRADCGGYMYKSIKQETK